MRTQNKVVVEARMFFHLARFGLLRFAASVVLLVIVFSVTESARSQQQPSTSLTVVATGIPGATGTITIAFNGLSESVSYGPYSTPASIASAFGAEFSGDPKSALPNLCTRGVCAKADGAKVVFQLTAPGMTFGTLMVTSPNNPFSINASAWPAAGATQIGVFCDPSEIALGETTDCTASLPAGTTGTVSFTVDSGSSQTASIDGNGDATITDVLQGGAAGTHVVTATYSPSGSAPVSGIELVVIDANPSAAGAPAGPVYSYNITSYAANSNILAYTDSVTGTWSSINYDSLNRLTLATQTPQPVQGTAQPMQYTCWNYDSFGNRLNQISSLQGFPSGSGGAGACTPNGSNYTVNSMQYNTANQITYGQWPGQTGGTPVYDGAGNMTSDLTNTYLYDGEGRVCAAQGPTVAGIPGRITGYLYDDAGQRVAKGNLAMMSCDPTLVVNGQPNFTATNVYVFGPSGEQMTELTPNPATGALQWKHTNVYAAGSLIATYDADTASNTQPLHFQIADWLGTRRVQTDYAGNIEETCTSFAFGDALNCVQTNSATADDATEHHFTNQIHDSESGLDFFGARYYAASFGRFMSPDWSAQEEPVPYAKLDDPQSLNLYAYVRNNPLGLLDPDGHGWWGDFFQGIADSTYRPFVQIVEHPIATAQGLGNAVIHPIATAEGIGTAIKDTVVAAAHGDGRAIGQIVGTGISAVATAGAVGAVGKALSAGALVGADTGAFLGEATTVTTEETYAVRLAEAQEAYPGKAGTIENHHIAPKYLGGAANGPTVPLDGAYHQMITNEFRNLAPYGTGPVSPEQLQNLMNSVYDKFPLPPGSN